MCRALGIQQKYIYHRVSPAEENSASYKRDEQKAFDNVDYHIKTHRSDLYGSAAVIAHGTVIKNTI